MEDRDRRIVHLTFYSEENGADGVWLFRQVILRVLQQFTQKRDRSYGIKPALELLQNNTNVY